MTDQKPPKSKRPGAAGALSAAARRVSGLLADVGQRPESELADEMASLSGSAPDDWPARVADLLGRPLTKDEQLRLERLRSAPPQRSSTLDVNHAVGYKPSGTL